jgi:hypothetical protein
MSKSRGPTKAQQLLRESQERVTTAEYNVGEARERLAVNEAVHQALQKAHWALERSLATTRKKRTPKEVVREAVSRAIEGGVLPEFGGALGATIDQAKANGKASTKKQVANADESAKVSAL